MSRFSNSTASRFLGGSPGAAQANEHLCSDVCTGIEIVAEGAVKKWNDLIGPADSVQAKINASSTLRAAFGSDSVKNAVHGSTNN